MKRIISLSLICLICIGILSACKGEKSDYDTIKASNKLVIGITIYSPMNFYETDGTTLTGFDTEFSRAVCEKLGVEPQFQIIDWKMKENELKSGNIDCIWNGLTVTEPRRKNMDFSVSYLVNKQCIVINQKDIEKFTDTASLKTALITAEGDSAGETAVKEEANLSKANYTANSTQADALLALHAGNFDAAIIDYTMAKASVGKGDYTELVIIEGVDLTDEDYAIGFRVGSDMTEKVNSIIAELIDDGTLAGIAAKYDMTELYEEAISE